MKISLPVELLLNYTHRRVKIVVVVSGVNSTRVYRDRFFVYFSEGCTFRDGIVSLAYCGFLLHEGSATLIFNGQRFSRSERAPFVVYNRGNVLPRARDMRRVNEVNELPSFTVSVSVE